MHVSAIGGELANILFPLSVEYDVLHIIVIGLRGGTQPRQNYFINNGTARKTNECNNDQQGKTYM